MDKTRGGGGGGVEGGRWEGGRWEIGIEGSGHPASNMEYNTVCNG